MFLRLDNVHLKLLKVIGQLIPVIHDVSISGLGDNFKTIYTNYVSMLPIWNKYVIPIIATVLVLGIVMLVLLY